jgi:hypothetical protein
MKIIKIRRLPLKRCRPENNIKMDFRDIDCGGVDWIQKVDVC